MLALQDIQYIDPLTLESLASRVCRGDASLISSEQQTSTYGDLVDYLHADGNGYHGTGLITAALCIFMWITVIARESEVIWNNVSAMCCQWVRKQNCKISPDSSFDRNAQHN